MKQIGKSVWLVLISCNYYLLGWNLAFVFPLVKGKIAGEGGKNK